MFNFTRVLGEESHKLVSCRILQHIITVTKAVVIPGLFMEAFGSLGKRNKRKGREAAEGRVAAFFGESIGKKTN